MDSDIVRPDILQIGIDILERIWLSGFKFQTHTIGLESFCKPLHTSQTGLVYQQLWLVYE